MRFWLSLGLAFLGLLILSGGSFADTIFFKDGTSIDCIVHEEKKIWKDIDDPNFYEIEVFGGYVGFWDHGQIDRIEKNDRYVPPDSDTYAYIRQLIQERRLVLPTGITEAGMIFHEQVESPISGRVLWVRNWAHIKEAGADTQLSLQADREIRGNQVISTERNSRLKFAIASAILGGLPSDSTLRLIGLNHPEHLSLYELSFVLEKGQFWCQILPGVTRAEDTQERVTLRINDCELQPEPGLLLFEILPDEAFRMTLVRGTEVGIRVRGTPSESQLKPGETLIVPLVGEKVLEIEPAEENLEPVWTRWDAWRPVEIPVTTQVMLGDPISAPVLGEVSAFGEGYLGRESTLTAPLMVDMLPAKLKQYRQAIERYKERHGDYPDPVLGLQALHQVDPQIQEAIPYGVEGLSPVDPWGRPLVYELIELPPREDDAGGPSIIVSVRSMGPNGIDEKGLGDDIQ